LRIALFHDLAAGGGKRHLYEQARLLAERGYEMELFAPTAAMTGVGGEYLPLAPLCRRVHAYEAAGAIVPPSPDGRESRTTFRSVVRDQARSLALSRLLLDAIGAHRADRQIDAVGRLYERIAGDIDAGGFDLVYVNQSTQMLAPDLLRHLRRTPSVFCCNDTQRTAVEWPPETPDGYDTVSETPLRRKRRGRLIAPAQAWFLERQEKRFAENTRAAMTVLANSWFSRENLARVAGVNAVVCYPGVDTAYFCPDLAVPREPVILSVGAMLPNKRHGFILEAVSTIPKGRRPRMEIVGYAGGPDATRRRIALLDAAGRLGVDLRIEGDVSDGVLRDAYRRAGVVAFAPYLEPLGLVAIEAMACGAPVVGIREGGVRETIRDGETGILTELDPVAFGQAILSLLTDPERARKMGERGRQCAVSEWTWMRSVDRLEKIFSRTVTPGIGMTDIK